MSSVNGVFCDPYLAIDEQKIILLTLFDIAAENTDEDAKKLFFPISYGEKTDNPS
tara:strand:- start:12 stop:176 length:165 start_codon:yes stop_codon:yes gene_type:complete